jgi:hypothetical protein
MTNVHVLSVDGSHWVREEDYREVERELREARAALSRAYADCADVCFLTAEGIPPHCGTCWTAAAQKCGDAILALKAARDSR